jgi:hypothetical protein
VTGREQRVQAKSLAVYLVPGLALLGAVVLTVVPGRAVGPAIALIAAGLAAFGAWKLLAAQAQWPSVKLEPGLWTSVGAYAGLAAAAALSKRAAKGDG